MISIITTSTKRPRQFALLEKYVQRQTIDFQEWIVVGEDHAGYSFNLGQKVIQRSAANDPVGLHSICGNTAEALKHVSYDKVAILDDDDWFAPGYLESVNNALDVAPLVGSCPGLYYRLDMKRWRNMKNIHHCSLTQTGFTRDVFPTVEQACKRLNSPYVDMWLWAHWPHTLKKEYHIYNNPETAPLMVGLKGIPWSLMRGAGLGHSDRSGIPDPHLLKLKKWIGEDWRNYFDERLELRR